MKLLYKIFIPLILIIGLSSMIISEGDDGYFVYLRGKKQYVVIEGKGEPTIVFLTGKGRPQTDFRKVYERLQESNQIFSYDRSGIGQ